MQRNDHMGMTQPSVSRCHFVLESGRPLFAWHHSPPPGLRRDASIVMCPPIANEYMSAYQTWKTLAERLAALGFDTVRFDYDGTGNSIGDDEEPGRVKAWLESIQRVILEARRLSGSSEVALIGLRAGGLLALQAAAERGGVERLVLWSPFPSGHTYVRELVLHARLSKQDYAQQDATSIGINVEGFLFTPETVADLDRWTLDLITTKPAADVLIIDHDDRAADPRLNARLADLGSRVTRIRPLGTEGMLLRQPEHARVPEQILDAITGWFAAWRKGLPPIADPIVAAAVNVTHTVPSFTGCERGVRFGESARLFGVLHSPSEEACDAPAIIFLNTSVDYHIGPSRLYVQLARELAADGHLVLRFDLGGIGESAARTGAAPHVAYPVGGLDDLREAISFIKTLSPRRKVILAGLCSGAWFALQATQQGFAVDSVFCVNPPLYLKDGTEGLRWIIQQREIARYRRSLHDPGKWLSALRGASYENLVRPVAGTIMRKISHRLHRIRRVPLTNRLSEDRRLKADRNIRSMFVFSAGDDGLQYFLPHLGTRGVDSGISHYISHVVVEGAGHTFRPMAAQQKLRALMTTFVASHTAVKPLDATAIHSGDRI